MAVCRTYYGIKPCHLAGFSFLLVVNVNRKQKKAKRFNATAHTKKQAKAYLTDAEEQKLFEWKIHGIDDDVLDEISTDCQRLRSTIKTALSLVLMFFIAYVVWRNW